MKNKKKFLCFMCVFMLLGSNIVCFAGQWVNNMALGRFYMDDNSFCELNKWIWLDCDNDGKEECYHFNNLGLLDINTLVDGYLVNQLGQWVDESGKLKSRQVNASAPNTNSNNSSGTIFATNVFEQSSVDSNKGSTIILPTTQNVATGQVNSITLNANDKLLQVNGVTSPIAINGSFVLENGNHKWKFSDGTFLKNGWCWIDSSLDGKTDGLLNCYYFDTNGVLLKGGVSPDFCLVNNLGQWVDTISGQIKELNSALLSNNLSNTALSNLTNASNTNVNNSNNSQIVLSLTGNGNNSTTSGVIVNSTKTNNSNTSTSNIESNLAKPSGNKYLINDIEHKSDVEIKDSFSFNSNKWSNVVKFNKNESYINVTNPGNKYNKLSFELGCPNKGESNSSWYDNDRNYSVVVSQDGKELDSFSSFSENGTEKCTTHFNTNGGVIVITAYISGEDNYSSGYVVLRNGTFSRDKSYEDGEE